jgi:hypothetical protein
LEITIHHVLSSESGVVAGEDETLTITHKASPKLAGTAELARDGIGLAPITDHQKCSRVDNKVARGIEGETGGRGDVVRASRGGDCAIGRTERPIRPDREKAARQKSATSVVVGAVAKRDLLPVTIYTTATNA